MHSRSRFDISDGLLLICWLVLLYLLSQNSFATEIKAHTLTGAKERNIAFSELFIGIPHGEVRLVFWHREDGVFRSEREALEFVLRYKRIRQATKTETRMFFDLYDSKTIKRHALIHARRSLSYEGRMTETLPKCFPVVVERL